MVSTKKKTSSKSKKNSKLSVEDALFAEIEKEFDTMKSTKKGGSMELKRQVEDLKAGHESSKIISKKMLDKLTQVSKKYDTLHEHHAFTKVHDSLKEAAQEASKQSMELRFEHEELKKKIKDCATKKDLDAMRDLIKKSFDKLSKTKSGDAQSTKHFEKELTRLDRKLVEVEETVYEVIDVQSHLHEKLENTIARAHKMFELLEILAKKMG